MSKTRNLVFASLFTALIIAGAYVRIPVGPVPVVLATMFVLMSGLFLQLRWAVATLLAYLSLGAVGIPVFSSGGGPAYFAGPTGGYLAGYLLAAVTANIISSVDPRKRARDAVAVVAATLVIYLPGVPWLKHTLGVNWSEALSMGLLPFLPGDSVKAAVAFALFTAMKRRYPELVPRSSAARKDDGSG